MTLRCRTSYSRARTTVRKSRCGLAPRARARSGPTHFVNLHFFAQIGDFGFAVHYDDDNPMTNVLGTAEYIAPEVLKARKTKKPYTSQCDMWSLGVMVYVMLSGNYPWDNSDRKAMFKSIRKARCVCAGVVCSRGCDAAPRADDRPPIRNGATGTRSVKSGTWSRLRAKTLSANSWCVCGAATG